VLLAPEQAFFLRENLKLKLLNARLGLLARQYDSARSDLGSANTAGQVLRQPVPPHAKRPGLMLQIQTHLRQTEQPSINDTLSALATAASSR
jgi:uroporphyrin-3 C-methyltransferase